METERDLAVAGAMKPLDRQKLDVVNQTRSKIFGWRGPFPPEFAAAL